MSRFRILTADNLGSVFGRQFESTSGISNPARRPSLVVKTFSVGLVRGAVPPVFNLPATRASVVRRFSGGLLFAGGVNGGDLFHVPQTSDIGDDSRTTYLGNLIVPDPAAPPRPIDARYGVYDLVVLEDDGTTTRFVFSYPRRNADNTLQVIFEEATITRTGPGTYSLDLDSIVLWYESQPPVETDGPHHGSGKMARVSSSSVYASVGDLGSGLVADRDNSGDLGRILRLTPTSRVEVSKGHRNIQGMVLVTQGNPQLVGKLFATEHGPKGGDELNAIDLDSVKDYGWPFVSLGDPYDSELIGDADPRNYVTIGQTNTHVGYEPPIFSWNPSIAPTEIVYLPGRDLFVMGTLRQKTIFTFRISFATETGAYALTRLAPQVVDFRIRSLAVVTENEILGSSDEGKVVVVR